MLFAMTLAGCEDVQWNWDYGLYARDPTSWRQRRPGRRVGEPASQPAGAGETTVASARRTTVPAAERYFQVVLVSEPTPADAPGGLTYVAIHGTSVEAVRKLLVQTYVPVVDTRGRNRVTLVYGTRAERDGAAEVGTRLGGLLAAKSAKGLDPTLPESLHRGVAALAEFDQRGPLRRDVLIAGANALWQAAHEERADATWRWTAAMLAAATRCELLADFAGARQAYALAEGLAMPGSVEHMTALYGRAHALLEDGRADGAESVARMVVAQFSDFRATEPYERCRRVLEARSEAP